jgi:hypothetical protein
MPRFSRFDGTSRKDLWCAGFSFEATLARPPWIDGHGKGTAAATNL